MKQKTLLLAALAAVLITLPAQAAITLTFEYNNVSGETTASWNGTWDIADFTAGPGNFSETSNSSFDARQGLSSVALGSISGPYPWSVTRSDWTINPGSDNFGFDRGSVYGPGSGFGASTIITGSMTRTGNLTDLGFASNTGGDS